jgi:hypothetical protein
MPQVLAASGLVVANRALLAAGLRRRVDGWRRATGLLLRNDCSTFVLSAFGLDVWSDVRAGADSNTQSTHSIADTQAHAATRLATFLAAHSASYICVQHGPREDQARRHHGPSYTLAFQSWIDGPARFRSPENWGAPSARANTSDLLNIVCRVNSTGHADIWMRVNHVGTDGVPAQEILSHLEEEWGTKEPVAYPTPESFAPFTKPRPLPGRPELCEIQTFIEFAPLLAWRKRENARLPASTTPMTLSAAMLWCLARHNALSKHPIGTTVEVAPALGQDRGVGVVVIRPADYFDRKDGLARYVADFNREMARTRLRVSTACKTLDAAALVPPTLAEALLRHALENSPRAFGTMALTMLKDARVFGAPLADTGHPHGFIAVGSVALPTATGAKVGCVTIKGPIANISNHPAIIREAIDRCQNA